MPQNGRQVPPGVEPTRDVEFSPGGAGTFPLQVRPTPHLFPLGCPRGRACGMRTG